MNTNTMKAMVVECRGLENAMTLKTIEKPVAETGEVLIKTHVAGVNYADIMQRRADYPTRHPVPYIPGSEIGGYVESVGEGVTHLSPGDRVLGILIAGGGYAEYAVVPAGLIVPLPDSIGFAQATALFAQGLTAELLVEKFVRPGQKVLLTAAAGGVGSIVTQLAIQKGSEALFAGVGDTGKFDLMRALGAKPFSYIAEGWMDELSTLISGNGVDLILDSIGGAVRNQLLPVLAPQGEIVSYGSAGGASDWTISADHLERLTMNNQGIYFFAFSPYIIADPGLIRSKLDKLFGMVAEDKLEVTIHPGFELANSNLAHDAILTRMTKGKVIINLD